MTDEELGLYVLNFGKVAVNFCKAFVFGLSEIFMLKKENGKYKLGNFLSFLLVLILAFLAFRFDDLLLGYLPMSLGKFSQVALIRGFALLFVLIHIKHKGDAKLNFLISFNEKFEAAGLYSKLTREGYDSSGKKIKVRIYPKFLKMIEDDDAVILIFGSQGIPLTEWQKRIAELEAAFDMNISLIDYVKGSKHSIRMVTVSDEEKERLKEERAEIERYDDLFEKVGLSASGTKDIIKDGKLMKRKNYPVFEKFEEDGRKVIYYFKSEGIAISEWKSKREQLESAFDATVLFIDHAKDSKQVVKITTVPAKFNIKDYYPWSNDLISEDEFLLVLGEGLLDRVTLNLNSTPHILIGGLTGSGKSVVERCLGWQCIKKGAKPYFVDFKGGLELGIFEDFGEVVFERKRVLKILDSLEKEHHERIKLFRKLGVKNIIEYNKKAADPLARVVLIVDEIAELMDTTGVAKEELKIYEAIEGKLNSLARLARATGINLILATQRPDATVIKGQIKNNIGARVSGRMVDKEPSMMVLGSPAATKIPEDAKGRFLFSLGADPIEFQGYLFKDEDVKPGNYQKGIVLVGSNHKIEIRENKIRVAADALIEDEENLRYIVIENEDTKEKYKYNFAAGSIPEGFVKVTSTIPISEELHEKYKDLHEYYNPDDYYEEDFEEGNPLEEGEDRPNIDQDVESLRKEYHAFLEEFDECGEETSAVAIEEDEEIEPDFKAEDISLKEVAPQRRNRVKVD